MSRPQDKVRKQASSGQRGFTLIEMLVSLAVTALIAVMLMQSLVKTAKRSHDELQDRTMQNAARLALSRVSKEIENLGVDTYVSPDKRQPKLVYAGPYQIVFNADMDSDLDPNDASNPRLGPINTGSTNFTQVGDAGTGLLLYSPTDSFTRTDRPVLSQGAETIVIGLDHNLDFNGKVEPFDTVSDNDSENAFWSSTALWNGLDMSRFATPNPYDHVLIRRVIGYSAPDNDNVRRWEILALGIHPWLHSDDASVNYGYPSDSAFTRTPPFVPPLLFQYWGYFCQEPDPNGIARPKECLFNDGNEDGFIDESELDNWTGDVANGNWSESDPPDVDAGGQPIPGSGGDHNADGVQNRSIDEVLTKIVVTINVEAPLPTQGEPNMRRSDVDGNGIIDGDERPYYYKDVTVTQTVIPKNVHLDGTNTEGLGM
jgi:prepilin-type N-terminal cleavage/methylation domain-containing protein